MTSHSAADMEGGGELAIKSSNSPKIPPKNHLQGLRVWVGGVEGGGVVFGVVWGGWGGLRRDDVCVDTGEGGNLHDGSRLNAGIDSPPFNNSLQNNTHSPHLSHLSLTLPPSLTHTPLQLSFYRTPGFYS